MTYRPVLLAFGIVALLAGLLFAAQGSGLFPYPRASFMVDRAPWIWRGLAVAAVGAAALLAARRRG